MYNYSQRHIVHGPSPFEKIVSDLRLWPLPQKDVNPIITISTSISSELVLSKSRNEIIYLEPPTARTITSFTEVKEGIKKWVVALNDNATIQKNDYVMLQQPADNPSFDMDENDELDFISIVGDRLMELSRRLHIP